MLLNQQQIKDIKERKVTYVKNFISFGGEHEPKVFDFNVLADHLHTYDNTSTMWRNVPEDLYAPQTNYILYENFSVRGLENREFFYPYVSFLDSIFKQTPNQKPTDCFMHIAFNSYAGPAHYDNEDVFITGLYGRTVIQTLPDKTDYILETGDMIFLPVYQKHKGISLTPRIVMSMGMYNPCN